MLTRCVLGPGFEGQHCKRTRKGDIAVEPWGVVERRTSFKEL